MLKDKTIIVTGVASGIGAETARQLKTAGARVVGLDRNTPAEAPDIFHRIDLTDEAALRSLLPELAALGADGLANIAGVPPTAPRETVLHVNLVALKTLTLGLVDSLAEGATIVNLASLAGLGWEGEAEKIRAAAGLTPAGIATFCETHGITGENSYFFTKQALIAWTHENRWT